MLLYKANKYIADYQWDSMTLEVNAVDMHWTDADIEQFKLGDKIKAHSSLHGLDRYFPLSKMSIQLNNLSSSKFTLGTVIDKRLTTRLQEISNTASKAVETIPVPVSYTHLRAHETDSYLVCRLLLEKKNNQNANETVLQAAERKITYFV